MVETVEVIREVDGVHTIVIGTAEWGGVGALGKLELPEDESNLICTFHYYKPMPFTHQGTSWSGPELQTLGVQWPGPPEEPLTPIEDAQNEGWVRLWFRGYNTAPAERNPGGPRPILDELDWAARQGERLGCPLWMGEFGAHSNADMDSRVRWTTFMREEAEKRGFSWAYWEFGAGFGIYDRDSETFREALTAALIPTE